MAPGSQGHQCSGSRGPLAAATALQNRLESGLRAQNALLPPSALSGTWLLSFEMTDRSSSVPCPQAGDFPLSTMANSALNNCM